MHYKYSSYGYYAEERVDELLTPSPAYLGLSKNAAERRRLYAKYVKATRVYEQMRNRGLLAV